MQKEAASPAFSPWGARAAFVCGCCAPLAAALRSACFPPFYDPIPGWSNDSEWWIIAPGSLANFIVMEWFELEGERENHLVPTPIWEQQQENKHCLVLKEKENAAGIAGHFFAFCKTFIILVQGCRPVIRQSYSCLEGQFLLLLKPVLQRLEIWNSLRTSFNSIVLPFFSVWLDFSLRSQGDFLVSIHQETYQQEERGNRKWKFQCDGVVRVLMNYRISEVQVKHLTLKYAITLRRKLWIENCNGIQFFLQFKHTD